MHCLPLPAGPDEAAAFLAARGIACTVVDGTLTAHAPGITLGTRGQPNRPHTFPVPIRSLRDAQKLWDEMS